LKQGFAGKIESRFFFDACSLLLVPPSIFDADVNIMDIIHLYLNLIIIKGLKFNLYSRLS
jgi:hypothetical protein